MLPPSAWTVMTAAAEPTRGTVRAHDADLTIRRARIEDLRAIAQLAQLDSAQPVAGDVLLAEADGRLIAALDIVGGRSIADPFTHSAHAIALLDERARQLRVAGARTRRRSRGVAGAFVRAVAGR